MINLKFKSAKNADVVSTKFESCPTFQSLKLRHQKFILSYLTHFNGTKAAREAGFSPKTANEQAAQLLAKLSIQEALAEVSAVVMEADIATIKEIHQFWTRVMRSSITNVCSWNEDGFTFTKNSENILRETAQLIKRIRVTERVSQKGDWTETRTEIELHDAMDASDKLARSYGIYRDKMEITGKSYEEQLRERIEARKAQGKRISP